jgi:hypothetical protein
MIDPTLDIRRVAQQAHRREAIALTRRLPLDLTRRIILRAGELMIWSPAVLPGEQRVHDTIIAMYGTDLIEWFDLCRSGDEEGPS